MFPDFQARAVAGPPLREIMMRALVLFAAAAVASVAAVPASATIILVDASEIQGDNVLFNSGLQTGTSVQGFTQGGTLINFSGTTVGGGDIIRANGGQARIEGALDTSTSNPNDTLLLQSLAFGLDGGGTFNNLELNLFNGGGAAGTVSFIITDNEGQIFNFSDLLLGTGSNFFGFQGILGESIANVTFTTSGGVFDVRQIRLDEVQAPIPEPGTWAMMLLGFAGAGIAVRRRRRRDTGLRQIA